MQSSKRIILTGASGWLASVLANRLADGNYDVVGVSRAKTDNGAIANIANEDFLASFPLQSNDIVFHSAFCRKSVGSQLIESLEYSSSVFQKAAEAGAAVINASSQAVYGTELGMSANEDSSLSPDYLYSLAKASSEVLLKAYGKVFPNFRYTNLRLASLMGVSVGKSPVNVISRFADTALKGEGIKVVGGHQQFSFLDVQDAADAVLYTIKKPVEQWKPAYTITPDSQVNIVDLANIVASSVARLTGKEPVAVSVNPSDIALNAGGSNAFAKQELGWSPKYSIEEIVDKMVAYRAALAAEGK